jgi:hypothetical protein
MFMCGGFFLFFFLRQHTHAAMHISRPKARAPITTPTTMTPTCVASLLLLPLLLRPPLLLESPPLCFEAGCDGGESLDGATGGEPLAAGAGGDNALLFSIGAGGGDTDGVSDGGGEPKPGSESEGSGDELKGDGDTSSPSAGVAMINV